MAQLEEKTRNGILCTPSVNPPRKQRMSFRKRSVTYVKSFLRAFTREKRYPTCFKFRFVSSPLIITSLGLISAICVLFTRSCRIRHKLSAVLILDIALLPTFQLRSGARGKSYLIGPC